MWYQDQHIPKDEVVPRRDKAQAIADEWHARMTTGIGGAHAAGLVAIVTFLNAHPGMPWWLLIGIGGAALLFLLGLMYTFLAMAAARSHYEARATDMERLKSANEFTEHFLPRMTPADLEAVKERPGWNFTQAYEALQSSYNNRASLETVALRCLTSGIVVGVIAIGVGSAISPAKSAPTSPPVATMAPKSP